MEKAIAVICSLDTKYEEASFLISRIRRGGCEPYVIDLSLPEPAKDPHDIDITDILRFCGISKKDAKGFTQSDWVETVRTGLAKLLPCLHKQSKFNGAIAIGGLQNTLMATGGMRELPLGVPKVMLSTVASGMRTMEPFVGISDMTLMHSVADLSGMNPITEVVLENAAEAVIGMVINSGKTLSENLGPIIGATLMGVVNGCATKVFETLRREGYQIAGFHSTGKGGKCLDTLIRNGRIAAALELSLHELICEDVYKCGYAMGSPGRLIAAVDKRIPLLVTPGGLDFIDFSAEEFEKEAGDSLRENRVFVYHNRHVVHVKVGIGYAKKAAAVVAERLNDCHAPVTVVLPLGGFRAYARKGEAFHDSEVDMTIIDTLQNKLKKHVRCITVEANMNDPLFAEVVSQEMLGLLHKCGIKANKKKEF